MSKVTQSSKLVLMALVAMAVPFASAHAMRHSFKSYDKDKNGSISEAEFTALYKKDDGDAVFKKLDVNTDGSLSKAELAKMSMTTAATAKTGTAAAPAATPAPVAK